MPYPTHGISYWEPTVQVAHISMKELMKTKGTFTLKPEIPPTRPIPEKPKPHKHVWNLKRKCIICD